MGGAGVSRRMGVGVDAVWGLELELELNSSPDPAPARGDASSERGREEREPTVGHQARQGRSPG